MLDILPLSQLAAGCEAAFGGKAAGLSRLIAAGARVPEGFAVGVTTLAPSEWLAAGQDTFRAHARALLEGGRLALRSSAAGEDSAERSFAGQFETVLDVATPEDALAAAARCIASGSSAKVVAYGGQSGVPVGVVVQRMVGARAAGVCFTLDPLGRDRAVVVEAVPGLGDALVSGRTQAEGWRVYRNGRDEWEAQVAAPLPRAVLTQGEAISVASQARGFHARAGRPLDLEWAIDASGALWWLQERPITAWQPARELHVERSVPDADDGPITVWSNWNVRETMPDPMHPLTWGVWREIVAPMALAHVVGVDVRQPAYRNLASLDLVQGRIYFNLSGMLGLPGLGPLTAPLMRHMDARAADTVRRLREAGVLTPRRHRVSALRFAGAVLATGLRSLARLPNFVAPRRALRVLERDARAAAGRPAVATLSERELLEEMSLFTTPACRNLRDGLQMEGLAVALYGLAGHAFRFSPSALALLGAGIEGPTTAISLAIERLATAAASVRDRFLEARSADELLVRLGAGEQGRAWLGELDTFLDEFGHRAPKEFDLGIPRWCEAPAMILDLVAAHLRSPTEPLRARLEALRARRRAVLAEAIASRPWWQRRWLSALARAVEAYMPLREAPKHYGMFVFRRMRQAALELGRRFVARSLVEGPEDVFFLDWEEYAALAEGGPAPADLKARVSRRRKEYEDFLASPAPDFVRSDGVPVTENLDAAHEEGLLRGAPISAGRASGRVLKLTAPDPRLVEPGDVIVMEFADPGWTPLFPRAAAVVMEVGGSMCHAAVVARELGVPAVFGVREAMSRLADGTQVEVDGAAGTVRLTR